MTDDDRTTISVDRTTHALVEDFRNKSETKSDAIRRAIALARQAAPETESFRAEA